MNKLTYRMHLNLKEWIYKNFIFEQNDGVSNIFDYNYNARYRQGYYKENYDSNIMYGIGTAFRSYAGYSGKICCTTEHGIPPLRVDNFSEFRDNNAPILLAHSEERRELIQPLTNKLIITYGPSFVPYAKGIYTDFQVKYIKRNNGKTLVIFPVHNNDVSAYVNYKQEQDEFIEYVKKIKDEQDFEEVIACLYYVDVERGMQSLYERQGWKVVCAGNNKNYDFADALKSIFQIADAVIVQGLTGVAYSTYLGIPCHFYKYDEELQHANGIVTNNTAWVQPTKKRLLELFPNISDTISKEQYDFCNKTWGYDCVKTPVEMKLILQYANEIHRKNIMESAALKRIAKRKRYSSIYDILIEAIDYRDENYKENRDETSTN